MDRCTPSFVPEAAQLRKGGEARSGCAGARASLSAPRDAARVSRRAPGRAALGLRRGSPSRAGR
eukprot:3884439-Alexandrium_andersonii.AAC.1